MIVEIQVDKIQRGTVYIEVPDDISINEVRKNKKINNIVISVATRDAEIWSPHDFGECEIDIVTINECKDDQVYDLIDDYVERDDLEAIAEEIRNRPIDDPNQLTMDFGELPIGEDTR
jgi:hypothetical protein